MSLVEGQTSMSRSAWSSSATQMMNQPSPVNVGIQANVNMSTRVLLLMLKFITLVTQTVSSNKLNIAVLQENVPGPQSGGTTYNPSAILPDGRYNHTHMLRHLMTGQYGVPITNISQVVYIQITSPGTFLINYLDITYHQK